MRIFRVLVATLAGLVFMAGPAAASEVCVDPLICVGIPTVTVTVPGPTEILPGPTVTVPGPTVTAPGPIRTVPGPTVTVKEPAKPAETIFLQTPGPTVTVTQTGQPGPSSANIRPTTAPTPVPTQTVEVPGKETVRFTPGEAVGVSALLLLAGGLLFLLVMYVVYYIGRREGENQDRKFIRDLADFALTRKR